MPAKPTSAGDRKLPLYSASVATIINNGQAQFRNLKGIAEAVQTLFSEFPVKPLVPVVVGTGVGCVARRECRFGLYLAVYGDASNFDRLRRVVNSSLTRRFTDYHSV